MSPDCCAISATHSRGLSVAVGTLEREADLRAISLHQLLRIPRESSNLVLPAPARANVPTEVALLSAPIVDPATTPPLALASPTSSTAPLGLTSPAVLTSSAVLDVVVSARAVVATPVLVVRLNKQQTSSHLPKLSNPEKTYLQVEIPLQLIKR